jgi:hypothetical protein
MNGTHSSCSDRRRGTNDLPGIGVAMPMSMEMRSTRFLRPDWLTVFSFAVAGCGGPLRDGDPTRRG